MIETLIALALWAGLAAWWNRWRLRGWWARLRGPEARMRHLRRREAHLLAELAREERRGRDR